MTTFLTIVFTIVVTSAAEIGRQRAATARSLWARWAPGGTGLVAIAAWMLVVRPGMSSWGWAAWAVVLIGTGPAVAWAASRRQAGPTTRRRA